jgi:sulfate/thiosulfate transport system permease protein
MESTDGVRMIDAKNRTTGSATTESAVIRWLLIAVTIIFLSLFLLLPLIEVFVQAFSEGAKVYFAALTDPEALSAIRLTLLTATCAVVCNTIFGLCAAWAIAKFQFRGKNFLITLIDLPFSVSPVIAGLVFLLLLGSRSTLGSWLSDHGLKIMFATPGLVVATVFVTLPFVARELIPLMQAQGTAEEQAAATLGAGGWRTFWHITLPNIRWGLLYGILLCNARAMGEFGAVSVVSGHIRGLSNTMPLQVEVLYNDYHFAAAFALASLLAFLSFLTLGARTLLEWRHGDELAATTGAP